VSRGWTTAALVILGVVAIVSVGGVTWASNTTPGERHLRGALIAGVLLVAVVVVGALTILRATKTHVVVLGVATVAGMAAVVFVVPGWAVERSVRNAQPGLSTSMSRLAGHQPQGCFQPSRADADIAPVGHVDEVCVRTDATSSFITITKGEPRHGLIYDTTESSRAPVMSKCVHRLFGPWWEVSEYNNDANCPMGFDAIGGG